MANETLSTSDTKKVQSTLNSLTENGKKELSNTLKQKTEQQEQEVKKIKSEYADVFVETVLSTYW